MEFTVAPITDAVIADILPKLRRIDRLELDCMRGDLAPAAALRRVAVRARRARAAYINGELVCIFGLSAPSLLSDVGCPWALVTRAVDRRDVRRAFIANSRLVFDWMGQDVTRMWNVVAEENLTARRWLDWLGFRFDGRAVVLNGHRFLHFEKELL